ncbi:hypothetical protein RyT2_15490 [Pseudolactococcus yaeyamensis]
MKKMLKIMAMILVGIVTMLLIAAQLTKNRTGMVAYTIDLINPFVVTEEVYGIVPNEPTSSWKDAANGGQDYAYEVKTYNQSGSKRTVRVTTFGAKIDGDVKYLKIKAKGQSVRGYDYIAQENLPKKVLKAMEEK